MIALDLFCGAGGASKGLLDAGFKKVLGIDIVDQKEHYKKASFFQEDVFEYPLKLMKDFNFIWASPPCQAYSIATGGIRNKGKTYPNLIKKTRELLLKTGKPFVIENVPGSPLRKDLILCGEIFGLKVIRHRIFEIHGFKCNRVAHIKHTGRVFNGRKRGWAIKKTAKKYFCPCGNHSGTLEQWQDAMEINWISDKKTLAQCIPPKYAEYIGKQFLEGIK